MKRAVIDIGTNSVLLLIGNMKDGKIRDVVQEFKVTRLGEDLLSTGNLSQQAMARTIKVLAHYKDIITKNDVQMVDLVGTESLRQAGNSNEFVNRLDEDLGWSCRIISGEEEGHYSYMGACRELISVDQEAVVVDVGGGSTEVVCGKGNTIRFLNSLPVGVVKLAEMYKKQVHLSEQEREKILHDVENIIRDLAIKKGIKLIGSGGTITTLVAIKEKIQVYDPEIINGYQLRLSQMEALYRMINDMNVRERKKLPGLLPGREDVILYGILIFIALMRLYNFNVVRASDRGLRFGYFYSLEELN